MTDAQPNLPPTSRRLSAIHDLLLDIATALGALRENGRLTEARLDRHGERLASAEASIISHQQVISTWKASTPNPHCSDRPKTMKISPNSTATSPAATTATDTRSLVQRLVAKLWTAGAKELGIWMLGKIGSLLLPYALAASGLLLAYGTTAMKWLGMLWRALIG